MNHIKQKLKTYARQLRSNLTDAEQLLWFFLRRRQLCGIQFYRQRPIGKYIVDFYSYAAKLVIEVDGGQHFETAQQEYDRKRDLFLEQRGLKILRFNNLEVLQNIDGVLEAIHRVLLSVQFHALRAEESTQI